MLKRCKLCGEEQPFHLKEKQDSKASGFYGKVCWNCFVATSKQRMRKVRSTEEGLTKSRASNTKSMQKRRKTDSWFRLRVQLAKETNQVLTRISNGGTPKDTTCFKLFGASLLEVVAHFNRQLDEKGLGWESYKQTWTCDHIQPVALAQSDVELKEMFLLENCQVLSIEDHAIKSLEDNALIRKHQALGT